MTVVVRGALVALLLLAVSACRREMLDSDARATAASQTRPRPSPGEGAKAPARADDAAIRQHALGAVPDELSSLGGNQRDVLRLPRAGGAFAPSLTEIDARGLTGRDLADVETCARCHADVAAHWVSSAHAFASFNNAAYRASVNRFRRATGKRESRFCAGCHDPALLVDGVMDGEPTPDDPRARTGVSCLVCHSTRQASLDGNGSYRLVLDPVPLPVDGDAASLTAHRQRLRPLPGVELCGSCHRSFLGPDTGHGHHLAGADDLGDYLASAYAGSELDRVDSVEKQRCRDCHMPPEVVGDDEVAGGESRRVASHRFAGGHSWMAAQNGDSGQIEATRRMLASAATLVVAVRSGRARAILTADAAPSPITGGSEIDVVVVNAGAGHRFPGGTRDMHDTWLEVSLLDADGEVVAESGLDHDQPPGHVLAARLLDARGRPVMARAIERFVVPGYDNTIAARDAQVVPYVVPTLAIPRPREQAKTPATALDLTLRVRLLHRSRERQLVASACEVADPAWDRLPLTNRRIDPCTAQPTTVIAEVTRPLRYQPEIALADVLPPGEDALWHGRAWQHSLVEEIDTARPSLQAALDFAPGPAALELARVAAKQGRIDEMELWLERASREAPGHPAIAYTRGSALARVWRNEDASMWLSAASQGAPHDARGWSALAVALGSDDRPSQALAAAREALSLAPRHPDALRVQALAVRAQPQLLAGEAAGLGDAAFEAFLAHRPHDDAPGLRSRCNNKVPGCAIERTPAHRHHLQPR